MRQLGPMINDTTTVCCSNLQHWISWVECYDYVNNLNSSSHVILMAYSKFWVSICVYTLCCRLNNIYSFWIMKINKHLHFNISYKCQSYHLLAWIYYHYISHSYMHLSSYESYSISVLHCKQMTTKLYIYIYIYNTCIQILRN